MIYSLVCAIHELHLDLASCLCLLHLAVSRRKCPYLCQDLSFYPRYSNIRICPEESVQTCAMICSLCHAICI